MTILRHKPLGLSVVLWATILISTYITQHNYASIALGVVHACYILQVMYTCSFFLFS